MSPLSDGGRRMVYSKYARTNERRPKSTEGNEDKLRGKWEKGKLSTFT